jgi:heterodisulfide reductase subunit A
MTDVGRHPNINILSDTELKTVRGQEGNFNITLSQKPRYVKADLCTGCGTCTLYCPVSVLNPFNENLSSTKAISISFPQAIPAVSAIHADQCLFLDQKKCKICFPVCKHQAIDFTQSEQEMTINAGAIIVSTGYDIFDSTLVREYGYGRMKNVINSLELERLLSADGPYKGEVLRPSDGRIPKRIAWFQCVGSRDSRVGKTYCSGVCCAYAIKQMVMVKSHYAMAETTMFCHDIRTYGKGIEDLYRRAEKMEGVRFIRKKVSLLKENRKSNNLIVTYVSNDHTIKEEEFDMVVLSVGLNPARTNKSLAPILGLRLNQHGFCQSYPFSPNETIRPGIYSAATFTAPMDIPDCISSVSGAVSLASQLLSSQRGTLVQPKSYPEERPVGGEQLRIGVFVCHCGANIAKVIDVPSVVQYASGLNNVVHTEEQMFSCSYDSGQRIAKTIRERGLNRVVVAACTPRTHESLFQETLREGGINKYLFEMANIREHCSWVHSLEKEKATQKAEDIVAMSVARASNLFPLKEIAIPIHKKGLVLGGGLAGMKAALALAKQGFDVYLVEKEKELGGNLKTLHYTLEGLEIQHFFKRLKAEVEAHKNIKVFKGYELKSFSGFVGQFKSGLVKVLSDSGSESKDSMQIDLEHGIVIVATGGKILKPNEYQYGKNKKIITQLELEERMLSENLVNELRQVVMIQCVGARNEERPYCSRICCGEAIKNALRLKELNKKVEILIFYRDIRTYGFHEDYYALARERGIIFIRFDPERNPKLEIRGENLSLTYYDSVLGMEGEMNPDLLVLSTPVVPEGNRELGQLLRVPVTRDGFFMEAHLKLRPLDFATDGIFLCGMAHYPKYISETISQANGAAARAAILLSKDMIVSSGAICQVSENECIGCGLCQKVCPYGAVELQETSEGKKARIIPPICKGCGACVSRCPTWAISQHHFTDSQILSQIHAAYTVPVKITEPKILAFLCNWCGYAAADLAGVSKYQFPPNIRVIRVMCSARVSTKFIMEAFSRGIDGILVVGCRIEDCHYISGIYETLKTIPAAQKALEKNGINPERVRLDHASAAEATKFVEVIKSFTAAMARLGSLELNVEQKEKLEGLRHRKKKGEAKIVGNPKD